MAQLRHSLKEAEAASAAKSRQIATVVHEIRTPLNGILGMAHLLGQTKLTAEQQNYLSGIRQSSYALAQLVEDLLDYTTLEAGRFRINNRAENLRQLIDSVVEMLAPKAHEKRIEIAATVSSELPELLDFDAGRIRQVLFNVIGNAVKFTSQGGVLARASLVKGTVAITVTDTGPGMTAEEQARIFREFEQVGSAPERAGGTGLGLGIASRILAEFGGSLYVTSRKGEGSTFTIRFPLWLAEDSAAGMGARNQLLSRSRVLLLAPDGPAATATVASIETLGGRCRHVSSSAHVQMLIDRAAAGPVPYTDLIVDHRLASDYACEPSHAQLHRILLVNPEERASQPQDFFDAWLIRPLREKSLIDVLSGRLRGFATRDALVSPEPLPSLMPADGPATPGQYILLGEDDPVNAMLVRAILKKAGHRVRLVDDFATLKNAAEETGDRPDLVICDMHMPGGTLVDFLSWSFTKERLSASASVPVVVLTGDARPELRQQVLRLGASRLLQKPIDPRLLIEEVQLLLQPATNRQQAR
ncbi:hybrid sensor histidine kinase/response regulator [Rhizobium deserti]|nr:ATP-binding protein [Rhizobium deserti]